MIELIRLWHRYGRRIGWTIWTTRLEQRSAARRATWRAFHGDAPRLPAYRRRRGE